MGDGLRFDYYYGIEAEQFSFYLQAGKLVELAFHVTDFDERLRGNRCSEFICQCHDDGIFHRLCLGF